MSRSSPWREPCLDTALAGGGASLNRKADQTAPKTAERVFRYKLRLPDRPEYSEERARRLLDWVHRSRKAYGHYPRFWPDLEVRLLLARLHRQVTLAQAGLYVSAIAGPDRCPARSSIHEFWLRLDQAAAALSAGAG